MEFSRLESWSRDQFLQFLVSVLVLNLRVFVLVLGPSSLSLSFGLGTMEMFVWYTLRINKNCYCNVVFNGHRLSHLHCLLPTPGMSPNAKRPLSAQMVLLVCLLSTDLSRRLSRLLYNALDILTRSPEKISHVEKFFFWKTKYAKCLVGELPYYCLLYTSPSPRDS